MTRSRAVTHTTTRGHTSISDTDSGAGAGAGVGAFAGNTASTPALHCRHDIEKVAQLACADARRKIRTGFTQLENNEQSTKHRQLMLGAVLHLRENLTSTNVSSRKEMQRIQNHKNVLKYSIGNCSELAVAACLFMKNNYPEINSELYRIDGGDHAFIIINRDPHTAPSTPEDWNDESYICDPWANKVYKTSLYLQELKNYHCDRRSLKGRIEDFDPTRHHLTPWPLPTTEEEKTETIHLELANFKAKIAIIITAFSSFKRQSQRLSKTLSNTQTDAGKELSSIFTQLLKQLTQHLDQAKRKINIKISNDLVLATTTLCSELHDTLSDLRSDCLTYQSNLTFFSKRYPLTPKVKQKIQQAVHQSIKALNNDLDQLRTLTMI